MTAANKKLEEILRYGEHSAYPAVVRHIMSETLKVAAEIADQTADRWFHSSSNHEAFSAGKEVVTAILAEAEALKK